MDDSASTVPLNSPEGTTRSSCLTWISMSVIATAGLSLIAAHAPARIRLLGLFFVFFGMIVGWGVMLLASVLDVPAPRFTMALTAALLTAAGIAGSTFETVRLERMAQSRLTAKERLKLELEASGLPISPDQAAAASSTGTVQLSLPVQTTLSSYLARRTRPLGAWKAPLPEFFWISELVLAMSASVWIAVSLSGQLHQKTSVDEPVKS